MKPSDIKPNGHYRGRDKRIRIVEKIYPETGLIYWFGWLRNRNASAYQSLETFARWARHEVDPNSFGKLQ